MVMTTVNIATLKQKLSHYIGLVEKGEHVVVTSHRRHVARLVPEPSGDIQFQLPTRSMKDLRNMKGVVPRKTVDSVTLLREDRDAR